MFITLSRRNKFQIIIKGLNSESKKNFLTLAISSIIQLSSLNVQAANPVTEHDINMAIDVPDDVYAKCAPSLGDNASCPLLLTENQYAHSIRLQADKMELACTIAAIRQLGLSYNEAQEKWGVLKQAKTNFKNIHIYPYGAAALGLHASELESFETIGAAKLNTDLRKEKSRTLSIDLEDKFSIDVYFHDTYHSLEKVNNKGETQGKIMRG